MKSKTLRLVIPLAVIVVIGLGFATNFGIGTLSAIGWSEISLLCPLGALGTMLATKMMVPQAVISLVLAVVAIIFFARAFCAWVCPVPVVSRLRSVFKKREKDTVGQAGFSKKTGALDSTTEEAAEISAAPVAVESAFAPMETPAGSLSAASLTQAEKETLASPCAKKDCASCASKRAAVDSRHFVLGGALLSAAIFGFPVFCLVCPIGLTFASLFLVFNLFAHGDVTWAVLAVPALLLVEVVFFRKWCHKFCPLGAFMSIIGKANRTFRPAIDDKKCLETAKGAVCGACAKACEEGIDPRHPERGASWSECTKCRACVDACPANAIVMPFLPPKSAANTQSTAAAEGAASIVEKG